MSDSLEGRVLKLENELQKLKLCKHFWRENHKGYPQVYFNICNAYIQCSKCGYKEKV